MMDCHGQVFGPGRQAIGHGTPVRLFGFGESTWLTQEH